MIIGIFFYYAAFTTTPNQACNMSEALAWIRRVPMEEFLYFAVSISLAAFGI